MCKLDKIPWSERQPGLDLQLNKYMKSSVQYPKRILIEYMNYDIFFLYIQTL